MKLSIFPDVLPLPKSKEEKHQQSKKASQCKIIEAATDEDLINAVTTYAWSPFVFHNNKRLASNFLSTDFLVYDIDEGLTIEACDKILSQSKLCALCLPSTSHTPENHRFRVVLPLARTITSAEVYTETWRKGAELFGVVDEQTKDLARFFFACTTDDGFWLEGEFFSPVMKKEAPVDYSVVQSASMVKVSDDIDETITSIYGEKREKVSEAVDFFVRNAPGGLHGKWMNSLNSFVYSLSLSGVSEEIVLEACSELAPNPLDKDDLYQIKRAYRDGQNA